MADYIELLDKSIPRDQNSKNVAVMFGYDPITETYLPLKVTAGGDGTYSLKVDAELEVKDIEIGAVELKNKDTDDRAKIETDGSLNVKVTSMPSITVNISEADDSIVIFGNDGSTNRKILTAADGKLIVYADDNPLQKKNITAVYTYVTVGYGIGKVETIKEYLTGAAGGAPAKLTTYVYNVSDKVASIAVSDTTV